LGLLGDLPELEVGLFVRDLPREAGMGDSFFVGTGAWGSGFIDSFLRIERTLNWSCFLARIYKTTIYRYLREMYHGDDRTDPNDTAALEFMDLKETFFILSI
jgi:hypothetical protein